MRLQTFLYSSLISIVDVCAEVSLHNILQKGSVCRLHTSVDCVL